MFSSYPSSHVGTKSFSLVENAFLQSDGLPFAEVLPEEEIDAVFAEENVCFAEDEDDVYTPAITLWAWLSQVLHEGKLRSCVAAVSRVAVLCAMLGRKPPSPDSGDYCRARAKLPERAIERLVYRVGDDLESRVPAEWLWLGRHVKVGDGTTLLAPDTEANQKAWPQQRSQKPGLGFPILRMVVLVSLATAALCGVAIGPYKGKETGEPALLRELLDRFQSDDLFLGDCCYSSYFLLALLLGRSVMAQAALSQKRLPRELSFAAALTAVAGAWDHATLARQDRLTVLAKAQWRLIAWYKVGNRPDRVEPRAVKRRPKAHKLLTKPRNEARAELLGAGGTQA
jgi:putative transposase